MNKYEKTKNKKSQNCSNSFFSLIVLTVLTLGCLGPSASDSQCGGIIKFDGKTFSGGAKDEKQAALNVCNKFCEETDAEFEAMYGIWLTSDKAERLAKIKGRQLDKFEAMMEDEKLLDYVTKTCAPRCVKEANKGKHTLETSCKK